MEFEEILSGAQEGDKAAIAKLLEIYKPMLVKNSLVNGRFNSDLYQELIIETLKCIQHFRG